LRCSKADVAHPLLDLDCGNPNQILSNGFSAITDFKESGEEFVNFSFNSDYFDPELKPYPAIEFSSLPIE
jgi:hypothetical protein